jgi:hypothetical protein
MVQFERIGVTGQQSVLSLHDQAVELSFPDALAADVKVLFGHCAAPAGAATKRVAVTLNADGLFSVSGVGLPAVSDLTRGDTPTFLMEAVVHDLISDMRSAVALHTAAVAHNGRSVMIAGGTGVGKSSLTAWLVNHGFSYITDEVAALVDGRSEIVGLPRALILKPGAAELVQKFEAFRGSPAVPAGSHIALPAPAECIASYVPHRCAFIVFPHFIRGASLNVEAMTSAEAGLRLVECNLNARNFPDGGFKAITSLARQAPAIMLEYGDFAQLEGVADILLRFASETDVDAQTLRGLLIALSKRSGSSAVPPPVVRTFDIPAPTPRPTSPKKLTIGMATFDDYDGVYFSIQALRLYQGDALGDVEFVVVDNHPEGACAEPLKKLEHSIPNYRYVPYNETRGTTVRQVLFDEACGETVMCIDSHVFIVPGAIDRLLAYLDANPGTSDLLQGPLIYDNLEKLATHFHPQWRAGMYGYWEMDERGAELDAPPFDIPMQGLGLFACRRAAWPGFNPRFRGFGGEEGYIHEKFRQRGGRALCLPFLRWMHRFNRPMGIPYTNTWDDRIRNYMIGFKELGLPTAEMEDHFRDVLGANVANRIIEKVKIELDVS